MLKSIEEKVDEQWVQEQKQRYTYKGFQEKLTVQDNMLNYSIEVNWDQSSESGKYTSEDFEKFTKNQALSLDHAPTILERTLSNQDVSADLEKRNLDLWAANIRNLFEKEALVETLAEAVRNIPNDQELGSAIREWYNRTEGKFI